MPSERPSEATAGHHRVRDADRADGGRAWEVFVRETTGEPLRHVGSVTAPSEPLAREEAGTLFADAAGLWLCPADEVSRYERAALGERASAGSAGGASAGDDAGTGVEP